nr:MAG TPA: hypothetical protein [Caudoviricetes sp.]
MNNHLHNGSGYVTIVFVRISVYKFVTRNVYEIE